MQVVQRRARAKDVSMKKTMEELCIFGAGTAIRILRNARGADWLSLAGPSRLRAAMWWQWKTPRRRWIPLLELGRESR